MAWLKCPACGEIREYNSFDMSPHGWNGCEEMDFHCKVCQRELNMEIDYDFKFFEALKYDAQAEDYDDIIRYTIPEARSLYEKQNRPSRFSLGGSRFSLGPPQSGFSLTAPGRFSLFSRRRKR